MMSADDENIDVTSSGDYEVDTVRVERIKQEISEGSFKVNSEIVADRLLEAVKELIKSKKGEV